MSARHTAVSPSVFSIPSELVSFGLRLLHMAFTSQTRGQEANQLVAL